MRRDSEDDDVSVAGAQLVGCLRFFLADTPFVRAEC